MTIRLIDGTEFLHIPKTGGNWVTKILEDNNLIDRHLGCNMHDDYDRVLCGDRLGSGKDLLRECGRMFVRKVRRTLLRRKDPISKPFRFCFVRHPLSWYESWWKYMSGLGWNDWGIQNSADGWHPNSMLNGLGSDDFNEFIRNVIQARPGYVSELFFSYTKPGISFIGKNENLRDDLLKVFDHLGFSIDSNSVKNSDMVNVSKVSADAIVWDPDLRKTVMMLELPALLHFGYLDRTEMRSLGVSQIIEPNKAIHSKSTTRRE